MFLWRTKALMNTSLFEPDQKCLPCLLGSTLLDPDRDPALRP